MITGSIFYVGSSEEVRHHAEPLFDYLPIQIKSPESVLQVAEAGDLAIFFSEHFDRFRDAIIQLRARNVATLYAIDGILEWRNAWENDPDEPACPWTMRPVLSHKVACIGPSQARVLCAWGNASKVELIGLPRFDRYTNLDAPQGKSGGGRCRILVTTAKCPGFTAKQRQLIKQSLLDVKRWHECIAAEDPSQIELVWRLTGELPRELGVENQLVETTGRDLADTLKQVDMVITTPSTVQLEAMLFGKPMAILDYSNSPRYVDAAWRITHSEQIDAEIRLMQSASARRMFYQAMLLEDALLVDGGAAQRMVHLIQGMLNQAAEQLKVGADLVFPDPIIEPAMGLQRTRLDHQTLFPHHFAFQQDDKLILQSELAHARREISHLHGQIESLRNELGEAHQIFEQIHQHPIAGPIVRTRQRVIDWMAKGRGKLNDANSSNVNKPTKSC